MERKVRAEGPVSLAGMTIVPVVEVRLGCCRVNGGLFFSGTKQPWAVLIIAGGEKRAFSLERGEVPLDEVLARVPGLGI